MTIGKCSPYKKGLMTREEYNLPLTKESYEHLKEKVDGSHHS